MDLSPSFQPNVFSSYFKKKINTIKELKMKDKREK